MQQKSQQTIRRTAPKYRLEIKDEARRQLKALSKEKCRNVGTRLDALQRTFSGDVKNLTAKTHEYRLRIGTLRVLFTLEKDLISVYAVKDRKEAYE
ncbi:MAG: type II toxin-antitoxin system RelE/ParE family toxin [Verrucomicrobia bacterium]|nr:type II toxin-antitoxin system RelE/ParE family toxin [Verrucomicrobiota bacterium]